MAEMSPLVLYRKRALRLLFEQTDGWKIVLDKVFALCKEQDALIQNPQWGDAVRFDAIGKKQGLLLLLDGLYREAEVPSPFDVHYARLLTALRLTPPVEESPVPAVVSPSAQQVEAEGRLRRRQAGGVA